MVFGAEFVGKSLDEAADPQGDGCQPTSALPGPVSSRPRQEDKWRKSGGGEPLCVGRAREADPEWSHSS